VKLSGEFHDLAALFRSISPESYCVGEQNNFLLFPVIELKFIGCTGRCLSYPSRDIIQAAVHIYQCFHLIYAPYVIRHIVL
jgi:hypothetical protein